MQIAVREIVSALYKVRKGGTAEACLLFPMFTAGCDALAEEEDDGRDGGGGGGGGRDGGGKGGVGGKGQREVIMERLRCVEATGMTQVCGLCSLVTPFFLADW